MYAPRIILSAFSLAAGLIFGAASSVAHPHVWVSVKATVLFEGDTMTGLQQSWTFDEAYTAMAIEGLDTNGDGNYDRKELEELAKVNVDGLKSLTTSPLQNSVTAVSRSRSPSTIGWSIRVASLHRTLSCR